VRISNNPVDAFLGGAALVTGVHPIPRLNGDGIRIDLGDRSKGIHVHMKDPEQSDAVIAAWLGTLSHLYAVDVDEGALCDCETANVDAEPTS
jgi:hypothetical protein